MEIEVIYENGVFKPLQKIDLKEGIIMKIPVSYGMKISEYRLDFSLTVFA